LFSLYVHFSNRTQDDNLTGLRTIVQKSLHMLAGQQIDSMQEAVHMVNNQELAICSDRITYASLAQGATLRDETDKSHKEDIVTPTPTPTSTPIPTPMAK
jgi:hypothetical protein